MKTRRQLTRTAVAQSIAAIFSASTAGFGVAHAADEQLAADTNSLPSITVTAQRRVESIQDVPITIQAITGDQMRDLGVTSIEDAVKYLPNVTLGSNGPGQGTIYMRGLSSGAQGNQSSATIAPFPNVALYVDDESMQFPARNVDVYLVDMERIEVLEGPQGTLFGGGAQAGVVRYITNKPKLNADSGSAEAGYGVTAGGAPNSSANAVLNLALAPEKLAVRAVVYNDHRGGYITNVSSNFTFNNNDPGIAAYGSSPVAGKCPNGLPTSSGFCVPAGTPVGSNSALTGAASNPVDYRGLRLSALYEINDSWDVLLSQSYQNMDALGIAAQYPVGSDGQPLGADQITTFSPSWDHDNYENTSWTVNGTIGDFKAVYTGSYLSRNIDQQTDYSNYSRTMGGAYYICANSGGLGVAGTVPKCYSPVASWRDTVKNQHQSHELRLSTPETWRLRGTGGLFWEDFKIFDVMNFNYKSIPSCTPGNLAAALSGGPICVANVRTAPGSTATNPGVRGDATAFGEDAQRGYKQTAVFGSLDYDLLPKVLTVTAGTRYYNYSEYQTGSVYATTTGCVNVPNGGCKSGMTNMDAAGLSSKYSGFRSRLGLTWHIDADTMAYATFSQGFRPGAFNRPHSPEALYTTKAAGNYQFSRPHTFEPDTLTNFEVGYKADFLNRKLQFDATAYHMVWKDVQFLFFDPTQFANTSFVMNGPDYKINGVELQLAAKVTHELTLQGSGSYNNAKLSSSPCIDSNLASSPTYGQCITQIKGHPFANPYGVSGDTPAFRRSCNSACVLVTTGISTSTRPSSC